MPEPSYELTFDEKDSYLYARLQCRNPDETVALAYLAEIVAKASAVKAERVLIDFVATLLPDYRQIYRVFHTFGSMNGNRKVAIVNRSEKNWGAVNLAM